MTSRRTWIGVVIGLLVISAGWIGFTTHQKKQAVAAQQQQRAGEAAQRQQDEAAALKKQTEEAWQKLQADESLRLEENQMNSLALAIAYNKRRSEERNATIVLGVDTQPSGARVMVHRAEQPDTIVAQGISPFRQPMPKGEYLLRVELAGHRSHESSFVLRGRQPYYGITMGLLPEPGGGGSITPATVHALQDLDQRPKQIRQFSPEYPPSMTRAEISGSVLLELVIDAQGHVVQTKAVNATHPEFIAPAEAAAKRWRFEPGRRQGQVVSFRLRQQVTFKID